MREREREKGEAEKLSTCQKERGGRSFFFSRKYKRIKQKEGRGADRCPSFFASLLHFFFSSLYLLSFPRCDPLSPPSSPPAPFHHFPNELVSPLAASSPPFVTSSLPAYVPGLYLFQHFAGTCGRTCGCAQRGHPRKGGTGRWMERGGAGWRMSHRRTLERAWRQPESLLSAGVVK